MVVLAWRSGSAQCAGYGVRPKFSPAFDFAWEELVEVCILAPSH
jgi:hypothetical protein